MKKSPTSIILKISKNIILYYNNMYVIEIFYRMILLS